MNWRTEPRDPEVLFVIEAAANLPPGFKAIKVVPGVTGHDKLQLITPRRRAHDQAQQRAPARADGQVADAEEGQRRAQRGRPAGDVGQPGGVRDQDVEGEEGEHGAQVTRTPNVRRRCIVPILQATVDEPTISGLHPVPDAGATGERRRNLRVGVAALAARAAGDASRALGRGGGTALPGLIAERLAPDLLGHLAAQLPGGVAVVTGTNGKTTTSHMLAAILTRAGRRPLRNASGSNLSRGIAGALVARADWTGRLASRRRRRGRGPATGACSRRTRPPSPGWCRRCARTWWW